MCPICIGTAALLASGGTSAGGLAALLFRQRIRKPIASSGACRAEAARNAAHVLPLEPAHLKFQVGRHT
jgi:hypothetical protein